MTSLNYLGSVHKAHSSSQHNNTTTTDEKSRPSRTPQRNN